MGRGIGIAMAAACLGVVSCNTSSPDAADLRTELDNTRALAVGNAIEDVSASPDAYGWQRCQFLESDGQEAVTAEFASSDVAVFDPRSGVGVLTSVTKGGERTETFIWRDGKTEPGPASVGRWGTSASEITETSVSLAPLRRHGSVVDMFDLTMTRAEVVDPGPPPTEEYRLAVESPMITASELAGHDDALRLEGLPLGWPTLHASHGAGEMDDATREALKRLHVRPSVLWVVDVWSGPNPTDDSPVTRLRAQTQPQQTGSGTDGGVDGGVEGGVGSRSTLGEIRFLPVAEVVDGTELRLPECPTDFGRSADGWLGFEPWDPGRSVPLVATFDEGGRPYDVEIFGDTTLRQEHLARLAVPDGRLLVMDGSMAYVDPSVEAEYAPQVTVTPDLIGDDGVHQVNVDVIWDVDGSWESVLGVWIGPADAPVAHWDNFEFAYGTDGGVGGIVAQSAADLAGLQPDLDMWVPDEKIDYGANTQLFDTDGVDGPDTLVFSNGWGDGGFPMSRGRDAAGEVVAVLIWRTDHPWRLAVPNGTPPEDVSLREQEVLDCFQGQREVHPSGYCT